MSVFLIFKKNCQKCGKHFHIEYSRTKNAHLLVFGVNVEHFLLTKKVYSEKKHLVLVKRIPSSLHPDIKYENKFSMSNNIISVSYTYLILCRFISIGVAIKFIYAFSPLRFSRINNKYIIFKNCKKKYTSYTFNKYLMKKKKMHLSRTQYQYIIFVHYFSYWFFSVGVFSSYISKDNGEKELACREHALYELFDSNRRLS